VKRPQFRCLCGPDGEADPSRPVSIGKAALNGYFDFSRRVKLQIKTGQTLYHGVMFADASSPSRRARSYGGQRVA